jgi:polygalacturonase
MIRRPIAALGAALLTWHAALALAQDRRNVVEPRWPPICHSLDAGVVVAAGAGPETAIKPADDAPTDTARIQDAINACPSGSGVELRSNGARSGFIAAPLELKSGVTLIVRAGAALFASRNPRDYDVRPRSCGLVDQSGRGCRPFIHVGVHDAAIMGDGVIDGRGGATLVGQEVSWWDLAQQAKKNGGYQNVPRIIVADQADNFVLYGITLRNSPNFHVLVSRTHGFTAWGVTIDAPRTARNTDGIDPSSSTDVSIVYSQIRAGDDNVAIKAGAAGPASHITVAHNHFYFGHGMSIGSETNGGVSSIDVHDLTIDGSDNGLRIKSNRSRGGIVQDVSYQDVCIRGVKNPIVLDSFYDRVTSGSLVPRFDVRFLGVRIFGGGTVTIAGADEEHAVDAWFEAVVFDDVAPTVHASHAHLSFGPGPVNLSGGILGNGPDVRVLETNENGRTRDVPSCEGRFVEFKGTR